MCETDVLVLVVSTNDWSQLKIGSDFFFISMLKMCFIFEHLILPWFRCFRIISWLPFPKCDIEGSAPNVTLSLSLPTNAPPLQDIVVHHCVTSVDPAMLVSTSAEPLHDSVYNGPYKFPFIPPSDSFNLCYYTSQVTTPPALTVFECSNGNKNTCVVGHAGISLSPI